MSRHAGFTLIELLIAIVLVAILASIAAPSVRDLIKNARMTGQANDLIADLSIARAEAVKRGQPTAVCTSNNGTSCTNTDWNLGWIIFTDHGTDKGGTLGVVDTTIALPDLPDAVLKRAVAVDGATDVPPNTITSTNHEGTGPKWVGFRPSGVVRAGGGGAEITFDFCDSRNTANVPADQASNRGRRIRLSGTGRAFIVRCTCASLTVCTP